MCPTKILRELLFLCNSSPTCRGRRILAIYYVKKHHEFLDNLFKCGYGHLFLNAIDQYVMYRWKKEDDSLDHIYRLHAFSGALYNSYIHWSLGGARESPEEMAKALRLVFADT